MDTSVFLPQCSHDSAAHGFRFFGLHGECPACDPYWRGLSPWTRSTAKRVFDCVCVLLALPVVVPLLLAVGLAVRLTSPGPTLFLQKRAGMGGRTFTIFKFRTMMYVCGEAHPSITTRNDQRFTFIGLLLRRWKLDELPQLANVLLGQMSLVGPRPKMPEFMLCALPCRPGVTGAATLAFAQEDAALAHIPREHLTGYIRDVVLPAKRRMDAEYLAQATLFSDLGLVIKTVLRRWNPAAAEAFIAAAAFEFSNRNVQSKTAERVANTPARVPLRGDQQHISLQSRRIFTLGGVAAGHGADADEYRTLPS